MVLGARPIDFSAFAKIVVKQLFSVIILKTMIIEFKNSLVAAAAFIERFQSSGQLTFDCCFYFQKNHFHQSFLCVAKPSTASMNDSSKSRGLELQKIIGVVFRFEDSENDIGTCLPIQVVVLVFLNFSSAIRVDSISKTARLIEFLIICVLEIERVKLMKKRFSELIHVLWIYMLH